jgi:4-oxalmesaconate hydratase
MEQDEDAASAVSMAESVLRHQLCHQPGIDLLTRVIPIGNILFASEMIGAVRGIDPTTGHHYDDTKRYVDAAAIEPVARRNIYEANARRVYPRLDAALKAKGR